MTSRHDGQRNDWCGHEWRARGREMCVPVVVMSKRPRWDRNREGCRQASAGERCRPVVACCGSRDPCALVGRGLRCCRPRLPSRRMHGRHRPAAPFLQLAREHRQHPHRAGGGRPVGDDGSIRGDRGVRDRNGAGASAGRDARAADPGRGGRRQRAGRREPRARRGLPCARAVGRRYLHRLDRLADRGMAAGAFGAMGAAPSSICRRRRDAPGPARLVPHGTEF
jgi:hypothetical protein